MTAEGQPSPGQSFEVESVVSDSFCRAQDPRELRQRASTAGAKPRQSLVRRSLSGGGGMTSVLNVEGMDDDDGEEKLSGVATLITLIGCMIGAGIMALPKLPVKGGCVLAGVLTAWTGFSTIEAGLVFFDTIERHNALAKRDSNYKKIKTFEDFGQEAAGAVGSMLVRISCTIWFIGLCSGYFILLAQQVKGLGDLVYVPDISYRACVLLTFPPLLVLSLQRDTAAIAKFMPLATGGGIISCVLIITVGLQDSSTWSNWTESIHFVLPPPNMSFLTAASMYATLNGAYAVVANLPSVAGSMADTSEFPWVYKSCIIITTVLNLCVMFVGHYGWGSSLQDSLVDSMMYNPVSYEESLMNHLHWTGPKAVVLPRCMIIAVTVNILLSYPLCLMCVFLSVENSEFGRANMPVGTRRSYLMRSATVSLTAAVAFMTQNFGDVFALFSSVCGPVQGIFFVFVFARKIRARAGAPEYPAPRKALHVFLMVCALFVMVFGLYDSAMNLMNEPEESPTSEPLGGKNSSNATAAPTASPTAAPTAVPTPSPTAAPTHSPGMAAVQAAIMMIS